MKKHPRPTPAAPWRWAWAGALAGLALVLLVCAPARWLAAALAGASGGAVLLAEPQGSVWSGSARLVLAGGAGSQDGAALPGRVHWRLRPALTGVDAQVSADCCTRAQPLALRASPRWGGARVALADGESAWPAALLAGLGTPWNTVQPQGELALATQGLRIDWLSGRTHVAGQAEITARQLSSRLSTLRPLGSYRLALRGGDAVALELSTLEGGLRLSGHGQWVGARLRFTGEARAAPGLDAQLANLLNLIGRRQGDRAVISLG
ncbi:MAG: type II secretion system protein N [Ottowia sp.]|uniref:type II secretion system protein N n=1 Tax=Ottowia sp. TaxID=1898956 RepID=UPI0039E609AE